MLAGLEVVKAIEAVAVNGETPVDDVVLTRVRVITPDVSASRARCAYPPAESSSKGSRGSSAPRRVRGAEVGGRGGRLR